MSKTLRILVLILTAVLAVWTLAQAQSGNDTTGNAARGRAAFNLYCSSCHGKTAQGDGPVAATLKVAPADLTRLTGKHGGKFPADWVYARIDGREPVVAHGPSDMPVWGLSFQDPGRVDNQETQVENRIRDLVAYLATLQDKTGAR
jgi:mono/diheme cytochrome c family protein